MLLRRTLAIVIAAGLAASCSGSSGGSPTPRSTGSGSPTPAALITSKAAAKSLARRINLRPSDLPAYKASPPDNSSSGKAFDKKLARCLGEKTLNGNELASVDSDDFSTGSGLSMKQVSSSVAVEKTPAAVTQDLAIVRSAHTLACFDRIFREFVDKQFTGATNVQVRTSRIDVPTPSGTEGAFGIRLKIGATVSGVRVTFYVSIRGAGLGQLELTVLDLSFGRPYPDATAERLLGVVTSRALARTGT